MRTLTLDELLQRKPKESFIPIPVFERGQVNLIGRTRHEIVNPTIDPKWFLCIPPGSRVFLRQINNPSPYEGTVYLSERISPKYLITIFWDEGRKLWKGFEGCVCKLYFRSTPLTQPYRYHGIVLRDKDVSIIGRCRERSATL